MLCASFADLYVFSFADAPVLNRFAQDEAYKDRPIAILVQPHLSMSIFNPRYLSPPGADESSASLVAMSKVRISSGRQAITDLSYSHGRLEGLIRAVLLSSHIPTAPLCMAGS